MDFLLLALLCPILMIAPGAWIACTFFDRNLGYMLRLALAIAFSPFVVGLQVLALAQLGVTFTVAAPLTLLNIFAFRLMTPKRARVVEPSPAPSVWAVGLCVGILTSALIAAWLIEPGLRTYSWHNFMQINPVYEVARLPEHLEEWDLAGYGIHFSWLGHVQIAVIAWLADTSPFYVHPVQNIGALFATIALLSACVVRFRPQAPVFAVFAATVAFLSTNITGIVLSYVGDASWRIGEKRLCSIFYKYFNFDLMTTGIALMCGVMLTAIAAAQKRSRRWLYLACVCAIAGACIYPFLFPLSFAMIAMAWAGPKLVTWFETKRRPLERGDLYAILAMFGALVVFAINIRLLGGEESIISLSSPSNFRDDSSFIIKALGLWPPLLLLSCYIVWKSRDVSRAMLLICGAISVLLYLLFRLPAADQYKFMFAGLLTMMPLAAAEAIGALQRIGRLAAPVGAATALAIVAIVSPHLWRDHLPWDDVRGPALRESGFFVEPIAPELAWTVAVRERSPADTVLFAAETRLPLSGYTARASYVPVDLQPRSIRYGYLMTVAELADVKALSTEVLDSRTAIVRAAYGPAPDYARTITDLARLHRPIAIVAAPDHPFIAWLRGRRIGATLYEDQYASVQLVSAGVTAGEDE